VFTPTTRRNCRQLVANSCTHRRRDETRQFCLVGVGGVYWAFEKSLSGCWYLTADRYSTLSQFSPTIETDVSLMPSPRFSPSTVSAVPPSSGPDSGSSCSNTPLFTEHLFYQRHPKHYSIISNLHGLGQAVHTRSYGQRKSGRL